MCLPNPTRRPSVAPQPRAETLNDCIMKNIDQLPFGFSLPVLSDEVATQIHNFLQIAIQIFEARYGEEIDRFYEGQCEDFIAATNIVTTQTDPPR